MPAVAAQQSRNSDPYASPLGGRRDAGDTKLDSNDPAQRPLGGRWSDAYSGRGTGEGHADLSSFNNPLGGRLQNDADGAGQVRATFTFRKPWCLLQV